MLDAHPFRVGEFFEDCAFHPILCTEIGEGDDPADRELVGISLLDGSERSCSVDHCGPEVLTVDEAQAIEANFRQFVERRMAGWSITEALGAAPQPDRSALIPIP